MVAVVITRDDDIERAVAAALDRIDLAPLIRSIDLAITIGHPARIGTGPIGGHTVETGLVIAGADALAADVVGARLLGFTPQAVRHRWEAARLELGETDTEQMEFPALSLTEAIERFTLAASRPTADGSSSSAPEPRGPIAPSAGAIQPSGAPHRRAESNQAQPPCAVLGQVSMARRGQKQRRPTSRMTASSAEKRMPRYARMPGIPAVQYSRTSG